MLAEIFKVYLCWHFCQILFTLKDNKTEELIKERSKELFFTIGKLSASTQEIADFAGVKRTLINYYFGSKQKLFEIVFDETRLSFKRHLSEILGGTYSVYEKVARLIDRFTEFIKIYPYYNIFLITELNNKAPNKKEIIQRYNCPEQVPFFKEIEAEMEAGIIPKMSPFNFYINIFALVSYPIIMRPYYDRIFDIEKDNLDSMYANRKEDILKLLFQTQQQ